MNFKNTYIKLKDSDKSVERIKEIADKYSRASGCELESYLRQFHPSCNLKWALLTIHHNKIYTDVTKWGSPQEITEQDLDDYITSQLHNNDEDGISLEDITNAEVLAGNIPDDDSIGSLVKKLYTILAPSNISISVNVNRQILISGRNIHTVDVSNLGYKEITKVYEAMVTL